MQEEKSLNAPAEPNVVAELRDLVQRAKGGEAAVLPRLRQLLVENPAVWHHVGDWERFVVRAWADLLAGGDPLTLESVRLKAEQLRADLEGSDPTPLEKLLIGQSVSHWLEMSHAQVRAADAGGMTAGQASYNL